MTMIFGRLLRSYDKALNAKPLTTKALSCITIFTFTDITSQFLLKKFDTKKKENDDALNIDFVHSAKFGVLYGGLWAAPLFHVFFNVARFAPVPVRILAQTVVIDSANISMCMFIQKWLKGPKENSVQEAATFVKEEIVGAYKQGLTMLPVSHVICNFLIPLPYRALYVSGQSYCWNTYLCCSMGGSELKKEATPSEELLTLLSAE